MQDISKIVKELDQQILAHSGVDSYEEIIKLLYLKLFDEVENDNSLFENVSFKDANEALQKADKKWPGIISNSKFAIPQDQLASCLQKIKSISLFSQNTSAFDTAIEHLLPYTHRGNRGQFMTPRHIAREIIAMIAPLENERILDPACGSGGFLEYAIFSQKKEKRVEYAMKNVFGTDYDDRMARIARLVCLTSSKTQANITTTNSLTKSYKKKFDIVVSNPPYGGLVTDENILNKFKVSKNSKGKIQRTHRHVLFVEKCIDLTKPGGRIALILPQGVLNNARMKKVHSLMFEKCRLIGVISLPQSTFMPHTNVKTSVVILEKWKKSPLVDYKVFMAISQKSGKDKKGKLKFQKNKIDHDIGDIRKKLEVFKKSHKINW